MAREELSDEGSLHGLARRHDIARNLIRIWLEKCAAGAFDDDQVLDGTLGTYEARIAALESMVGQLTMELDALNRSNAMPAA